MRSDGMWIDAAEVAWFAAALDTLVKFAGRAGCVVPPSVRPMREQLQTFLDGHAGGGVDATSGLSPGAVFDSDGQWIDAGEVADMLDLTASAVRKACRTGRFAGVARKHRGRWWIPTECVDGGV